jgi:hypothetical protein
MRVYIILLFTCVGLIVFAAMELPAREMLLNFATDNFKIVLGAVIGSLSTAATAQWGKSDTKVPDAEDSETSANKPRHRPPH